jgi:hypothetical protein
MHVREVNPVENSTSLYSLECKSPHWQNSKLASNSFKFLAQEGNRTQASREQLNLTLIKHQVILMAVYPGQKHCEEWHHKGLKYLFLNRARIAAVAWTHDLPQLPWQVSSSLYRLRHPMFVYSATIKHSLQKQSSLNSIFSPIAALVVVNCALFVQTVCSLATVQGKSFLHLQTMGRDRGGGAQLST